MTTDYKKRIDFEKTDLSELIGGWKETSTEEDRWPSVGWPNIEGDILIKLYLNEVGSFNIAVITDGGVKERHDKDKISEVNLLLLWLLVREDCINKCTKEINREMNAREMYNIITKNINDSHMNGFIGEIKSSEIMYGGDISVEVLEYFGLDPYRRY